MRDVEYAFEDEVLHFVGAGEERWIMHFARQNGTMGIVEKTIDYRIWAYDEDAELPEYNHLAVLKKMLKQEQERKSWA